MGARWGSQLCSSPRSPGLPFLLRDSAAGSPLSPMCGASTGCVLLAGAVHGLCTALAVQGGWEADASLPCQVIFITEYVSSGSLKQFLKKTKKNHKAMNARVGSLGAGTRVSQVKRVALCLLVQRGSLVSDKAEHVCIVAP